MSCARSPAMGLAGGGGGVLAVGAEAAPAEGKTADSGRGTLGRGLRLSEVVERAVGEAFRRWL